MISYTERPPHPFLSPWVRCFWQLTRSTPRIDPQAPLERVLPDGCIDWVFHFGEPFRILTNTGTLERQAPALLAGMLTQAILLEPSTDADVIGVRFHPGGASAFLSAPADQWTNHVVPLEQSEDSELQKLHTRLYEAAREQRVLLLEEVLLRRAARLRPKAKQIVNAVDALVNRCASIDTVATQCSIGIRQLERRFQREVGITPQALLQIVRFQRAVRLLESDAPLSRVAYEAGYSDQAHFGRKFVAFTGTTPAAYRREAHALATAFANTD